MGGKAIDLDLEASTSQRNSPGDDIDCREFVPDFTTAPMLSHKPEARLPVSKSDPDWS